jgi:hypothetical protein
MRRAMTGTSTGYATASTSRGVPHHRGPKGRGIEARSGWHPKPGKYDLLDPGCVRAFAGAVASIIGLKVVGRDSVLSLLRRILTVGSGQILAANALVGHMDRMC